MRGFLLLPLALIACAPAAPSTGSAPRPPRVLATGDGAYIDVGSDNAGSSTRVSASTEQVWAILPEVYRELGIEVGTSDPSSRLLGNQQITASRRFAGEPLTNLLRCGTTATGAPIASTYRIRMSVLTNLQPVSATETGVRTVVQATATNNAGVSTDPVACASTGALEERIATEVQARLGT